MIYKSDVQSISGYESETYCIINYHVLRYHHRNKQIKAALQVIAPRSITVTQDKYGVT